MPACWYSPVAASTRPSAGSRPSTSAQPRSPRRSRSSARRWRRCPGKSRGRHACFTQAMPIRVTFARLCRETRARLGLTQQHLADTVGVTRGYIAKAETERANPTFDLAERIAVALDIAVDIAARVPAVIGPRHQRDL